MRWSDKGRSPDLEDRRGGSPGGFGLHWQEDMYIISMATRNQSGTQYLVLKCSILPIQLRALLRVSIQTAQSTLLPR